MKYVIKKGKHRGWPFRTGIGTKLCAQEFEVVFHESCRYNIGTEQKDINKLFGVGFVKGYFRSLWIYLHSLIGGNIYQEEHHIDSARIGWAYNPETDKIDLYAYCYINSQRIISDLISVEIDQSVGIYLYLSKTHYVFIIKDKGKEVLRKPLLFTHNKRRLFPLGLYFGGNLTAPHDIHITMNLL